MAEKPFFSKAIVLLLISAVLPAVAQEIPAAAGETAAAATETDGNPAGQPAAASDPAENAAPVAAASPAAADGAQNAAQSREPDYEEIFRWGMDDQILSTLKTLTEEKKTVPAELIDRLYAETLSESVKAACLDYWRETENPLRCGFKRMERTAAAEFRPAKRFFKVSVRVFAGEGRRKNRRYFERRAALCRF